jgi:hypothetical protein
MSDMNVILNPEKTSGAIYPLQNKIIYIPFFNHDSNGDSLVCEGNAGQFIAKERKRKSLKMTC